MAVNEQIVTGRKFRKLVDEVTKLWQRISFWTKASDVEFDDGENAEIKVGAINGVTDSLTSTSSNIAASAKAVKELNDKVTQLSSVLYNKIIYSSGYVEASKMPAIASTELTVPAGVKTGLLIVTGYGYDETRTMFEVTGVKSMQTLLYNYYPNPRSGVLCIYKCTLNPGEKITAKFINQDFRAINVSAALVY